MQRLIKLREPIPASGKGKRASHVYRIAAEIMCQKGYEGTSMNDIAEAAGLTKAGIYHYIRGKEELLFEIMTYAMDNLDQRVIAPAQEIADPEERLRAIVEGHTRSLLEGVGAITTVLEEMPALTAAHRRIIKGRKRAYFDVIRQTLQELESEGKLRNIDLTTATFSLLGMILWISRWYRRGGKLSADRVSQDYVEIAMNGVLKSARGNSKR
ncbi:MAG TPA: TetR/AcrR family transcriptional regulator [Candidatus Acidoferrales bacterium]|nr:TetR/AcrR family transcriptional regulator [Candidatus Acidoferrales bacterium]